MFKLKFLKKYKTYLFILIMMVQVVIFAVPSNISVAPKAPDSSAVASCAATPGEATCSGILDKYENDYKNYEIKHKEYEYNFYKYKADVEKNPNAPQEDVNFFKNNPSPQPITPKYTGGTNGAEQPSSDQAKEKLEELGSYIAKLIDNMFQLIVDAINRALANLSKTLLALTIVLASLDIMFTMLSGVGSSNLMNMFSGSIPRYITYAIVMTLLRVDEKGKSLYMKLTIGDFSRSSIGSDVGEGSIMKGFMNLAESFFPKDANNVKMVQFSTPGTVIESLLAIPFKIIKNAYEADGLLTAGVMFVVACFLMYYLIQLAGQTMMAFIEYIFVVGLSMVYLPFLVNSATSSVASKIITNIVSKGVGLTIQLGLIGVAINVLVTNFTSNGADNLEFTTAFETLVTTGIAVYVAGKGADIAKSILSGEGAGLKASEMIARGSNAIMGMIKTVATIYTGGMARGLFKNEEIKKSKETLQNATESTRKAEKDLNEEKSPILNSINKKFGLNSKEGKQYSSKLDNLIQLQKQSEQDLEKGGKLEANKDFAEKTYGKDSAQYKEAENKLATHQSESIARRNQIDNIKQEFSDKVGVNISDDTLGRLSTKTTAVADAKEVQKQASENYDTTLKNAVENSKATKFVKYSETSFKYINATLGGDKDAYQNEQKRRNDAHRSATDAMVKKLTGEAESGMSTAERNINKAKDFTVGMGAYAFNFLVGVK